MSQRTLIHRHRLARQLVTGQPMGMILRDQALTRRIRARQRSAASPDPTPTQAALEASLLHVACDLRHPAPLSPDFASHHPLGYTTVGGQRHYIGSWLTPHQDQLVIESSAPDNWMYSLSLEHGHRSRLLEGGRCRLGLGLSPDGTGWIVGPERTSVVFCVRRWRGNELAIELGKRPFPSWLAQKADQTVLEPHPTDRLLSALVRRFLFADRFLSGHMFFEVDGDLGLALIGCSPETRPGNRPGLPPPREGLSHLGLTTARQILEASYTDDFFGVPNVHGRPSKTDDLFIVDDLVTGGRLLLTWTKP